MGKLQADYVVIGAALPVNVGAGGASPNPNPIIPAVAPNLNTVVTVQPGVVFQVANIQANLLPDGGGEFLEVRVLTSAGVAEANTFAVLHANGDGTFKLDDEQGSPNGKFIGPFLNATQVQVGIFAAVSGGNNLNASATAALERVIPNPANTTIV